MDIQFTDLKRQYLKYKDGIDRQIQEVLQSSQFIQGPKVQELEQQLAEYIGVKHAIGCSSGTDALFMALLAYGVKSEDEIITTPFTFIATSEAIAYLNAKPVFVDIDATTYNIDSNKIEAAITPKTKGIIAVDMFGQCADYEVIMAIAQKHNLFVIEDAAQSFGAQYKDRMACSLGQVGCTSFFPAKPFGCYGDGGMVFTDDDQQAEFFKSIRVHGQGNQRYSHNHIGLNARLDTLQAAVLVEKFKYFPRELKARKQAAAYYDQGLKPLQDIVCPVVLDHNISAYAQYSIRVKNRQGLIDHLRSRQIPTAVHYPIPIYRQKAFEFLGLTEGSCPETETVCQEIMSLPMHPFLLPEEQDHIIQSITDFY
ncbi:MAG: DegT/DnrJ/EryC1/StrS family aminotransferase [Candidatus Omnitrophica bacterium]|nr:DegT/DnrJ/EryC1/StrS family aminotransferase [Candidatus Omnitrophota bacterium]